MKAFFGKIWAWVLANKVLAAIIAGGTAVVLAVAIAVPCGVSASKKKKAAQEQESQQQQQQPSDGGEGQQGGEGGEGGGQQGHTHNYVFKEFAWKETPNNFTADAVYECAADHEQVLYAAEVTKTDHTDPTCMATGSNHWHASYDGHEDDKVEGISALGHLWGEPDWIWAPDHQSATATFHCERAGCTDSHEEVATVANGDIQISHTTLPGHEDDGEDSYVATVALEGNNYSSDPEPVIVGPVGHDWNGFGYCGLDGAYLGDPVDLVPGVNKVIGEMDAGDIEYFRVPITAKHLVRYALTELDSDEVSFAYNNHGTPQALALSTTSTYVENIGADGYIYIKVEARVAKTNASITLYEFHYGNYYGVCHGCEEFLFPANELEVGVKKSGISLTKDVAQCYRCPAEIGHTYSYSHTNLTSSDLHFGYIGENGIDDVRDYDLSDPFPEDSLDNYIYLRITPSATTSGASLTINVVGHAYNGLGLCSCGAYAGSNLTDGVQTGLFDLAPATKKFYHYVVVGTGDVAIHLSYPVGNSSSVSQLDSEVYIKTGPSSYELCGYNDGDNYSADWQNTQGFFNTGDELYIVISNPTSYTATNVTVTLTEA